MEKITKRRWLVWGIIFLVLFFLGFWMGRFDRLGNSLMSWILLGIFLIFGIYLTMNETKLYKLDEFEQLKNLQIYASSGNIFFLFLTIFAILSLRDEVSGFLQNFHWYQIFGAMSLFYGFLVIIFSIFYQFFPPKN